MSETALRQVRNEAPKLNIHQRIFEVIKAVDSVEKSGVSREGGHTYNYHEIDAVVAALKPHLISQGIFYTVEPIPELSGVERVVLQKTTDKGELRESVQWTATNWCKVVFHNVDDLSDRLEVKMWGMGISYSDKSTGVAVSYSLKTLLLALFQLRGQPDPEKGEKPPSGSRIPRETGPACAKCGSVTYRRKGKDGGEFWGCSKYPDCKSTTPIEPVAPAHKPATERLKLDTIDALEQWRDDPRAMETTIEGRGGKEITIQSVALQILLGDHGEETAQGFLLAAKEKLGDPQS